MTPLQKIEKQIMQLESWYSPKASNSFKKKHKERLDKLHTERKRLKEMFK